MRWIILGWRKWRFFFRFFFLFGLFIGFSYFLLRVTLFFVLNWTSLIDLWNTSQLEEFILTESNLNGLVIGNTLLLLSFIMYLVYNLFRAFTSRSRIYFFASKKVHEPVPVFSIISFTILFSLQSIILIDLLSILDAYNIQIFDMSIQVGDTINQITTFLSPIPIEYIILSNFFITIIVIGLLFNSSGTRRYIKERNLFKLNFDTICEEEIESIIHEENYILKNLKITQAYHDLSIGMSHLLGNTNVNWSTYACWASKTAGRSIRKEDIPKIFQKRVVNNLSLTDFFDPNAADPTNLKDLDDSEIIWNMYVLGVIEDISINISKGNLKVFKELGPIFSNFIHLFQKDSEIDENKLQEFQKMFIPGRTEDGGQDLIKEAFSRYYYAIFETDPKKKAEMMLFSNIQVGVHEQIRLQEAIEMAVTAPLRHGFEIAIVDRISAIVPSIFKNRVKSQVASRLSKNKEMLPIFLREIVTTIMELELPKKRLILSKDVPRYSSKYPFPPDLLKIEDEELMETIRTYDSDTESLKGSNAEDWADLRQRLGFIVDLFRTTQQNRILFYPPFNPRQTKAILTGNIPNGPL